MAAKRPLQAATASTTRPPERQPDGASLDLLDHLVGRIAIHDQDAPGVVALMSLGRLVRPRRRQHEHHHVGGVEHPQIPAVTDLPFLGDTCQRVSSACHSGCCCERSTSASYSGANNGSR
jgi:hypothetical protein